MNKTSPKAALAAAILTLSLALTGCAATNADTDMPGMSESDGDSDSAKLTEAQGFAQMMIPHHLQAITMAGYAKANAKDPQVLALAQQIYTDQAAQVETMKGWLGSIAMQEGMMSDGMLTDDQMTALSKAKGAEFDKLFLEGMTAHHRGAIAMATALQESTDPELKKVVTSILQTQTIELAMMKLMAK